MLKKFLGRKQSRLNDILHPVVRKLSAQPERKQVIEVDSKIKKDLNAVKDTHEFYLKGRKLGHSDAHKIKDNEVLAVPKPGNNSFVDDVLADLEIMKQGKYISNAKVTKDKANAILRQYIGEIDHELIFDNFGHTKFFRRHYPELIHWPQVLEKVAILRKYSVVDGDEKEFLQSADMMAKKFGKEILENKYWRELRDMRNSSAHPVTFPRDKVLEGLRCLEKLYPPKFLEIIKKLTKIY